MHGARPGSGGTLFSISSDDDPTLRSVKYFLERVPANEMIAWLKGYKVASEEARGILAPTAGI